MTPEEKVRALEFELSCKVDDVRRVRENLDAARARLKARSVTAAEIVRAAAVARGEVVPLPTNTLAQQIIAAGRRQKNAHCKFR
jgi:hypothetical protein